MTSRPRPKAPQWCVYRENSWGKTLLGRVRAHTEDGAMDLANRQRRMNGWDKIELRSEAKGEKK